MGFSLYRYQLLVGKTFPKKSYFNELKKVLSVGKPYEYKDKYFIIKIIDLTKNYFAIHLVYGNGNHYSPEVVNAMNKTIDKNPKERNQVEPFNELFIIYFFSENDLLLSNYSEKSLAKYVLTLNEEEVEIKNKYVSLDEFTRTISKITEVRLYIDDSLFRNNVALTEELDNYLGFGARNQYDISAKVNVKMSERVSTKLKKLMDDKSSGQLGSLVCVGENDEGISTYLNNDKFNRKIIIEVEADENGHHNYKEVISKIKRNYRV